MRFTDSHEWISVKEGIGTVGITDWAQKELGEIVYVELPTVGRKVRVGEEVAVLESTKAAADVYAPASGEIIEINQRLSGAAKEINSSAEKQGWLFRIKLSHPQEVEALLKRDEYFELINRS